MFKRFGKSTEKVYAEKKTDCKENPRLTKVLEENMGLFKTIFSNDDTFMVREFQNKYLKKVKGCLLYIEEMADNEIMNENIIQPLLDNDFKEHIDENNLLEEMKIKIIASNSIEKSSDVYGVVHSIINGDTALLLQGHDQVLVIGSKGWQTRGVEEPQSERVVRGPREGFNESLMTNLSMVRRKIKNPDLKFKFKELGVRTRTKTCICYIEGLASDQILRELNIRLDKIDLDSILDSGYIQEFIKDAPFSPFETIGSSERPDAVAGKLLEGRIALFVDGSPFVLTLPFLFLEYFQVNEDYYNNYIFSSFIRVLRIVGAFLSVSVPAVYVALITFHQEMIPTPLLLSISAARQGVPFPTILEALLMVFIFEVLREAGARMPTVIGQAISIVGALVLGQAAVEAKIVSAPMVIVVGLTGITSLLSYKMQGSMIFFRYTFLLLASFLGMYGYVFGLLGLTIHLMGIRSFGVPYTMSFGSMKPEDIKDSTIRAPWWYMDLRPRLIAAKNIVRKSRK